MVEFSEWCTLLAWVMQKPGEIWMIPSMPSVSYTPFLREEGGGDMSSQQKKGRQRKRANPCTGDCVFQESILLPISGLFPLCFSVFFCRMEMTSALAYNHLSHCGCWAMLVLGFFFFAFFCFCFWPHSMACRILVPQPGIEPTPPAVEAWNLNHWTTKEIPVSSCFYH